MTAPTVFISYSQDSDEHKDRILHFADRLRDDGIDANLDQYQTNPSDGWQLWMEKQIRDSQFVILVCTETYLKRVMKEDDGRGKGVMWESTLIYSYLYEAGVVNQKFIPVVFGHENTKHIPTPLKPTTFYDISTDDGYKLLYRRLTNQPDITKPDLGKLKSLPKRAAVSLAKLPSTSSDLFGREKELALLDKAWNGNGVILSEAKNLSAEAGSLSDGVEALRSAQSDTKGDMPKVNVVTLVAWGGVGKSALVNKWLTQMARDNYRGAERAYGWSFYSQGAAEDRQASSEPFIAAALNWFGDPEMAESGRSAWEKGERLAELIRQQRALLILDGLEPLQTSLDDEGGKTCGEIRDKSSGLVALLRELAAHNPGLVVISSRLKVDNLKDYVIASPERSEWAKQSPNGEGIASGWVSIRPEEHGATQPAGMMKHWTATRFCANTLASS